MPLDTELKSALDSISSTVNGFKQGLNQLQKQVDAIDAKTQDRLVNPGGFDGKSIASEVFESQEFTAFAKTARGRIAISVPDLHRKTAVTVSAVGSYTTGVVMPDRLPGILPAAFRTFRVRDLLRSIPTTMGAIDFVKTTGYTKASPQVETNDKLEATLSLLPVSERVKTIAHWIPASKQAMQDVTGLQECIDVHLMAGLRDEEDRQLLSGDNTGENLNGLITQATAFDTSLLSASQGWEYADLLGRAIQQLAEANLSCEGIVLNPRQWWAIRLLKDANGNYVFGDPSQGGFTTLWGIPVSVTTGLVSGTFLVGAFQSAAALYMRMDGIIEVSDSHSDYFIKNMVAIRCEERLALCCYRPAAFITGQFSRSPA